MEDLIKKWKTIIKNEKSSENQDFTQSSANFSRLKSSEKSNFDNSSIPQTNKSESLDRKNKFLKESNKDLKKMVRSSSKNKLEQPNFSLNSTNFNDKKDEVVKKLNKIIKYLKKSNEIDKDDLISKLNEAIDCHNETIQSYKSSLKSFEENEVKLKAKNETTDKIIKDYESKYIVCEKEKNKLKKEYDLLLKDHEDLIEVTKTSGKNYDLYKQIEESNKVLLKNNSTLLDNVNELKKRNDWIIQNYEEETQIINQKLNTYKEKLNKLYSIYQINVNNDGNNCLNQENY